MFEADDDVAAWTVGGAGATVAITREAAQVREGRGALLCGYTGAPGSPFSLSAADLELSGVRSLTCSLKPSSQAPLVLILTEQDGSIYHTFATCPGGEWTDVALSLADFQLQDGSQDENGALDADQIGSFTVQELANMPGGLGEVFGTKVGPQALVVDRVSFSAQALPSPLHAERGRIMVDDFGGPCLRLLPVGGAELSRVPGADGGAPSAVALRFAFAAAGPRAWPGIVLPVGTLDLSGATAWRLRAKSPGGLKLTAVLEEWDGSKYEATVTFADAADWSATDVPLSDLKLDPSTTDENGALDIGQVRVVVIVADALNMLLDENEQGTYALDDVVFLTG
jgi:hypothetical protein